MLDSVHDSYRIRETLTDVLAAQASERPESLAYEFIADDRARSTLTYGELFAETERIAAGLQQFARPGERALLIYPAGIEFVSAFLACVRAGVIAVSVPFLGPRRTLPLVAALAADSNPAVALSMGGLPGWHELRTNDDQLRRLNWFETDNPHSTPCAVFAPIRSNADDVVMLQYTSGSTSQPRGVVITHRNLLANLEAIRQGFQATEDDCGVFWLPHYHDMGLVGGILTPLYVGGRSVLLSPAVFVKRPRIWLETITAERATISGGSSFGFDLCLNTPTVGNTEPLELSAWRVAFCGAEPVQADTLETFAVEFAGVGFRREAFYPCYGLAEATLLAAGGRGPAAPTIQRVDPRDLGEGRVVPSDQQGVRLVGCGAVPDAHQMVIVDPQTQTQVAEGVVGEIRLAGPSVALGYWNRPDESQFVFGSALEETKDGPFLRTGDLGFIQNVNCSSRVG